MSSIEELKKKYKLSDEKNEFIYRQVVEPVVFDGVKPTNTPRAVIVGGQSGAGKYALLCCAKREENSTIIISSDNYKEYHPDAELLKTKYPVNYIPIVDQDAGIWTAKCLKKAIDEKYSYAFEGTLKNTRVMERMKESKDNGFKVILKVLATSNIESILSIFERYEKEIEVKGTGRLVSLENHNFAYNNIPNTVDTIEKSGLCDEIQVYIRGESPSNAQMVYSSNSKDELYKSAREAIIRERIKNFKKTIPTISKRIERLEFQMLRRTNTNDEKKQFQMVRKYLEELANDYDEITK